MNAAAQRLALAPGSTEVTLRAYALGVVPVDGAFSRFHGALDYDPAQPDRCGVELVIEAASLSFSDPATRDEVLSPAFLDAAAFPTLVFRGVCAPRALRGQLMLRGQTHPFELALTGDAGHLVATGTLDRTEWGMTQRGFTVGSSVRIQVTVSLPNEGRSVLPGLLTDQAR